MVSSAHFFYSLANKKRTEKMSYRHTYTHLTLFGAKSMLLLFTAVCLHLVRNVKTSKNE